MDRAPPGIRGSGSRRPTAPVPNATQFTKRKIVDGLEGYIELGAGALSLAGDIYSAYVWERAGPRWVEAMADAAMVNAQLRRILDKATDAGTWGSVVIMSLTLLSPVVANHAPLSRPLQQMVGTLPIRLRQISAEDWEKHVQELKREADEFARAFAEQQERAAAA